MVVGLTASLATVVGGYYYSKRAWRKIQAEIEAQELICSVETDEADYVPNTSSSVALNHLERSSSQDSGIALAPMSNSLVQSNNLEMLNVTIQPRNTTLPPLGDLAMVHILGDDSSS
uniref:Uncharacterized protein n=2 Tax=Polyblepharides amylifera TaxID=1486889 RepID=A0A7R9SVS5_9CHLO|mmetsp:Transcript_862/g.1230  ORF Transcript_862/g.1230 Transcript_862/m.1230 type:complete len:117 (+) Transcript_862:136-486(+)